MRALRACRFLAPSARREAAGAARALRRASAERVRDELEKLLLSPRPDRGLEALEQLGLLGAVLPELTPLLACVAGEGRPSVSRHTLDALARSARPGRLPGAAAVRDRERAALLYWTLLVHDLAKPETLGAREDGRPTFHGHETLGARRADALLRRLKLPGAFRRRVAQLVRYHLRPHHLADAGTTPRGVRRLVRDAGADLPVLVLHAACDALASGSPDAPCPLAAAPAGSDRASRPPRPRRGSAAPHAGDGDRRHVRAGDRAGAGGRYSTSRDQRCAGGWVDRRPRRGPALPRCEGETLRGPTPRGSLSQLPAWTVRRDGSYISYIS